MKTTGKVILLSILSATTFSSINAQDWPQWRGANRDAKVSGFEAPKTWPKRTYAKVEGVGRSGRRDPSPGRG
jgi:hypothetical protein